MASLPSWRYSFPLSNKNPLRRIQCVQQGQCRQPGFKPFSSVPESPKTCGYAEPRTGNRASKHGCPRSCGSLAFHAMEPLAALFMRVVSFPGWRFSDTHTSLHRSLLGNGRREHGQMGFGEANEPTSHFIQVKTKCPDRGAGAPLERCFLVVIFFNCSAGWSTSG